MTSIDAAALGFLLTLYGYALGLAAGWFIWGRKR